MTPTGTVLATGRFTLTPLAETDRGELFAHFADPETVEYMDIEPLSDLAGADAIIARAVRLLGARQGVRWAIRDFAVAVCDVVADLEALPCKGACPPPRCSRAWPAATT